MPTRFSLIGVTVGYWRAGLQRGCRRRLRLPVPLTNVLPQDHLASRQSVRLRLCNKLQRNALTVLHVWTAELGALKPSEPTFYVNTLFLIEVICFSRFTANLT